MSEEWKVQVSYKTQGGALLNVRGGTAQEVQAIVDEARELTAYTGFFPQQAIGILESTVGEVATDFVDAQAAVTKHLGPGQEDSASQAQVQYLVNLGVPAGEARGLSKKDASARIKALKESK